MKQVFVSQHPLVRHKQTLLRRIETEPKKFRVNSAGESPVQGEGSKEGASG